jgi:hypothetical protein
MKDFKKMPKMACGGSVGKYEEGGKVDTNTVDYWANKRSAESKAAADQRMTDYKESKEKSSSQFKENMGNIGKDYDKKIAEAKVKYPPTKGGGSMGGGDMSGMKGLDKPFKRGGKVTKKKK